MDAFPDRDKHDDYREDEDLPPRGIIGISLAGQEPSQMPVEGLGPEGFAGGGTLVLRFGRQGHVMDGEWDSRQRYLVDEDATLSGIVEAAKGHSDPDWFDRSGWEELMDLQPTLDALCGYVAEHMTWVSCDRESEYREHLKAAILMRANEDED